MKFETEYKNIHFIIILEAIVRDDYQSLFGDKFQRLSNNTMIELKKGHLIPYNLLIESTLENESRTHYWSNVLLSANPNDLAEDLGQYLNDEDILDEVASNWESLSGEKAPAWRK